VALFTTTAYPLVALIEDISLGKIGLPEIQRPFVWPNVNVRNLFDSLYRGYPAGYLLFWETGADPDMRRIGEHHEHKAPSLAIVAPPPPCARPSPKGGGRHEPEHQAE